MTTATEHNSDELLKQVKEQCESRGIHCIKGFSALFRGLDRDYSKNINCHEFKNGLKRFGVEMSDQELKCLFTVFDKDHSGLIDFREFMTVLRPALAPCRLKLVNEVFDILDTVKDGVLQVEDLKCK